MPSTHVNSFDTVWRCIFPFVPFNSFNDFISITKCEKNSNILEWNASNFWLVLYVQINTRKHQWNESEHKKTQATLHLKQTNKFRSAGRSRKRRTQENSCQLTNDASIMSQKTIWEQLNSNSQHELKTYPIYCLYGASSVYIDHFRLN